LSYGYYVVRELDAHGDPLRGQLAIDEAKAAIVRRIFEEYAAGSSPRAIAAKLNEEGIKGPAGKPWGPSTIYGNWRRGTGILNNELYVGRRVWNRQRFVKDPTSGKRVTRYNRPNDLVVQDASELRIIADALWHRAKDRQKRTRLTVLASDGEVRSERARRPAYLLSGLLRCGVCGGGFSKRSETHYACSTAHDRATCSNRLRIRRDVLEASVLSGLKTHLMQPDLVHEFMAEYHRELERLGARANLERNQRQADLAKTDREIGALIEAIKCGIRSSAVQSELQTLETRKEHLIKVLQETRPVLVRLHSGLAELYKRKVASLEQELNGEAVRAEGLRSSAGLSARYASSRKTVSSKSSSSATRARSSPWLTRAPANSEGRGRK
jgi:hypothetical protein